MKKKFYLIFCICISVLISTKAQSSDKVKKNPGKLVGVAYSTWHQSENWENVWGKPKLGFYRSDDEKVICQHGKWLTEAGVDFIFVDWSNFAAWRADNGKGEPQPRQAVPEQGRLNGLTFRRQWNRADSIGVKIALVVSWNEWSRGEQPSAEISKDIEPSENFGYFYLDLLQKEIQKFRSLK